LRAEHGAQGGFGHYLWRLARLDWGYSYVFKTPVADLFLSALPWTLLLMGSAHVISMVIGFVAGVEAAWRRNSPLEKGMVGGMTVLEGIPEICTGVILLFVFALQLQWFPAAGAETAYGETDLLAARRMWLTIWHSPCAPWYWPIFQEIFSSPVTAWSW
jgi:peptide/nickel transport system permease protein